MKYCRSLFVARWLGAGMLATACVSTSAPVWAQMQTTPPPAATASPSAESTHASAQVKVAATTNKTVKGIDLLIKHLHDNLKITPAQEQLWQGVADVMRENADNLTKLAKDRADNAKGMTAIDDLKSYSDISQAHADATKKLIAPFQALYDSMSDEQKKAADTEFREHYQRHHRMS